MKANIFTAIAFTFAGFTAFSQRDSLLPKVSHAEPLYSDLVRDLGARKGEHEWNIGAGYSGSRHHEYFSSLVEYEFAPINRLGFEIEIPFAVTSLRGDSAAQNPETSIEGVKLATQYTFFVSPGTNSSLAIGYTHEFEFVPISKYHTESMFHGNDLKPFLVAAKRWGSSFHTMLITGPEWEMYRGKQSSFAFNLDASAHYVLPGTGHFAGLELNSQWGEDGFVSTLRPQMRLTVSSTIKIGLVSEIPLTQNGRHGFFCRLIYEPKAKLFTKKRR